ncbi:hypothetical protein BJX64DRAFT_41564 [Aspergillus heterothallicus]
MARHLVSFAALALGILTETTAQSISSACTNTTISISSQADIYALLNAGCNTLNGQLEIKSSFEGEFILPNVTSIEGNGIVVEYGAASSSSLTSIELPDLVDVASSIELGTLERVRKVSMPKLKSVPGVLSGTLWANASMLEFGKLEKVRGLELVGNFTSLEFPSLQTVNETLSICNVADCGDLEYAHLENMMDLSFPVLESANVFYIKGSASRIFAPNITVIGMLQTVSGANSTNATGTTNTTNIASSTLKARDPYPGPQDVLQGLNLNLQGTPVNISFPSLVNVTPSMNLKGPFQTLTFPNMTTYPDNFTVKSTEPLYLTLPVVHAGNLEFLGFIRGINMSNLIRPYNLTVYTSSNIYCEDIIVHGDVEPQRMQNVFCSTRTDSYVYIPYNEPGLSTVQKVVIAVVVIGVVALGVVGGIMLWKWRQARRGLKTGLIWRAGSMRSRDSDADSGPGKGMDVEIARRGSPPPYPGRPMRSEGV